MKRFWSAVGMGIGGLAFAVALSLGALALAGGSLRQPAAGVPLPGSTPSEHAHQGHASPSQQPDHGTQDGTVSASPAPPSPIGVSTDFGTTPSPHGSSDNSGDGEPHVGGDGGGSSGSSGGGGDGGGGGDD